MRKSNNPFASKEYLFLLWLSEHQLTVGGKPVVKYSQKELAAEYGSCETTVNRWLATLREVECISVVKKGAYSVTPKGQEVIAKMNAVEKVLGGKRDAG